MSTIPAYLDPHNPLYYAPRHLRHERDAQPRSLSEPTAQANFERKPYDHLLEQAVADALRDPPDASEFVLQKSDYTFEPSRLSSLAGVALRFSTAMGSLVVIALFVAWVIPFSSYASRTNSSPNSSLVSDTTPETATSGYLMAETRNRLMPPSAESTQQSDNLLQQFVQWQQKPSTQYATGSLSK